MTAFPIDEMERQLEEFMKGRLRTFFTERMLFFVDKIVEMHEHDRRHLNKVLNCELFLYRTKSTFLFPISFGL